MKRIINYLILLSILCVVLSGCTNDIDELLAPPKVAIKKDDYGLQPVQQLNIKVTSDQYNTFHESFLFKDSLLYGVNFFNPYTISIIDLSRGEYLNEIKLEKHLVLAPQISGLFVSSPDSIFLYGILLQRYF